MKYLLDTSVLIHSLLAELRLNQKALRVLRDESAELYLSSASVWEIAIKEKNGKLLLPEPPREFLRRASGMLFLRPLEITQAHALAVGDLPHHHRDPFDRMLIAQAREEGMTLLTADRALARYEVDNLYCGR